MKREYVWVNNVLRIQYKVDTHSLGKVWKLEPHCSNKLVLYLLSVKWRPSQQPDSENW
jgi:hypothetical protein